MPWIAPTIAGAAGYIGGRQTNNANQELSASARQFNSYQARLDRRFQERMSNTAVQRRMRDLRKAGINPILAGKFDASSPSGSAASAGGTVLPMHDPLTPAVNSALQAQSVGGDVKLKSAHEAVARVEERLKENLIPGSEVIGVVSGEIEEAIRALNELLDVDKPGYRSVILDARETLRALSQKVPTAPDVQAQVSDFMNRVDQWLTNFFPGGPWNENRNSQE